MREREAFQEVDYRAVFGGDRQMGDRDRRPGAHSRTGHARLRSRDVRPAGAGRHRAARGHADRDGRGAGRPAATAGRDASGRGRDGRAREAALARPSARSPSSAAAAGRRDAVAAFAALRRALGRCRSRCSFRRQMLFDHLHPNYAGDVGIGTNPKLARAHQGGRPGAAGRRPPVARCPPQTTRCSTSPTRDQKLVHVHPDAGELGRVYRPTSPSTPRRPPSPPRSTGVQPAKAAGWAASDGQAARATISPGRRRPRPVPGARADGPSHGASAQDVLPDDAILRNGAGNYATWVHRFHRFRPLRHAARADLRLDGLRHAGGGRGQAHPSRTARSSPSPATAAS